MRIRTFMMIGSIFLHCSGLLFAQGILGDYRKPGFAMGQTPPGRVPVVFSPGLISVAGRWAYDLCFSKDGLECYFTVRNEAWTVYEIMVTRFLSGQWTAPTRASFSTRSSMSPFLSDDGQTIFFHRQQHVYKAERTSDGWTAPVYVASPISSPKVEYSCRVSGLGNAWVCSHRAGGVGDCDIWYFKRDGDSFAEGVNLLMLNTSRGDCGPVPGPDESYVLWYSNRPGGFGGFDLYISLNDGKGGWTPPRNLGADINTGMNENAPTLSPDMKYLFFSRDNATGSEIFWVSVDALISG